MNKKGKVIQEKWYDHKTNLSFINDFIFNETGNLLFRELENIQFKPYAAYDKLSTSTRYNKKYYWEYDNEDRVKERYEEDDQKQFYLKKYHYTPTGYIKSIVYGQHDKVIWTKSTYYENDKVKKTVNRDLNGNIPVFKIKYYSYNKNSLTTEMSIMDGELEVEQNKIVTAMDALGSILSREIYTYSLLSDQTVDLDLKEKYVITQDTLVIKKVEKGILQITEKTVSNKNGLVVYNSNYDHIKDMLISEYFLSYNEQNQVKKVVVSKFNQAIDKNSTYTITINYVYDNKGNWTSQTKMVDARLIGTLKRQIRYQNDLK